jgi:hypothetical protein
LSSLGDRIGDPRLKAVALFLSMTLYGDTERFLIELSRPELLVCERQPLLDSLAYAGIYSRMMTAPLDPVRLEPMIEREIGKEGFVRLLDWLETVSSRVSGEIDIRDFWKLPLSAKALFERPRSELLMLLQSLYGVGAPSEIIVLTLTPAAIGERLLQKRMGGSEREIHERQGILESLQGCLLAAIDPIRAFFPAVRVRGIDPSDQTVQETCETVLRLIGAPIKEVRGPRDQRSSDRRPDGTP